MLNQHKPVMKERVISLLHETGGDTFLDITTGNGSYLDGIHEIAEQPVSLYGIDRDPKAIKRAVLRLQECENVNLICGNHADLTEIAERWKLKEVDGIVGDFGLSTEQLEEPSRGFSYRNDSPLDMRYSPESNLTASDLINNLSHHELTYILRTYGEERLAGPIAAAIIRNRP